MSLITRCPTCETMFRVVPDQLRVSEGWVRCGQCSEIFDATQNMVPPTGPAAVPESSPSPRATVAPPAAPAPVAAPPPAPPPPVPRVRPAQALPAKTAPAPARPDVDPIGDTTQPVVRLEPTAPIDEARKAANTPDPNRVVLTAPGTTETIWTDAPLTDPLTALIDEPEPAADPSGAPVAPTSMAAAASARLESAHSENAHVSFLQKKSKPSFWQSRTTRIVLSLLLLALLVALAVQIFMSQRDRIAALEPATRPLLLALCAWQGCTVQPLRQIESVVIDSSSFSRIRGDDYRLGFSLKNNAPIAIAMPAIELALTDPQDQPVIRRVIHPAEFGAASDALAGASVWNGSIALNVKPVANGERIAGYRLLAFYP